jgi:hypothetical protein
MREKINISHTLMLVASPAIQCFVALFLKRTVADQAIFIRDFYAMPLLLQTTKPSSSAAGGRESSI